ncbi:hypothetical protein OSTOST_09048 [Ostertagia ostertagi]
MELDVDLTALKPARDIDDYPKMPEIAFDKDTNKRSAVSKEEEPPSTNTTTPFFPEVTTESSSSLEKHKFPSMRTEEITTEVSIKELNQNSSSSTGSTVSGLEEGEDLELTTQEPEPETTEFIITTTTHPPYCIPYRDHPTISRCHKSLMAKLSAIAGESPESASVRFPLYNVSIDTLVELCDDFGDAKKCMDGVENLCRHPLLEFFDQQFTSTCKLLKMRDFDVDYVCIQEKLISRTDCMVYINGTVHPEDKCTGHEDFLRWSYCWMLLTS